jgi:3-(3-hydroxy-phenyl)propionate hydroxylase
MMRSPEEHWPVVVVGAGPTGLTLANLLGRAGVATLVLERNHATVQEPRAVSIDDESLRTMQAAGLVEEVMSEIVPGYGSHYFDAPGGRCFLKVEPSQRPYGYPRRNAFRQPVLERQLRAGLERFPDVHLRFEHSVETFTQTPEQVRLTVRRPFGAVAITCDYLVGCDGAGSTVRRGLGIPLLGSSFEERWLIVDLENSQNRTRHTEVFCNPERPCITLPGPHHTRRFEFRLHPSERETDFLAPENVSRLLADHHADPNAAIRRKVVYTFHARLAARWSEGRVFLAGDAAHLSPPFAGQGMNSGVRDAHNLAWKLALVLGGEIGAGLLATYEQERRDHVCQMIQLALRMGRVMSPPNGLAAWTMRSGFRALGLYPPARDYFSQMKYKPAPRYASGFLLPDGRSPRRSLVGRLLPQPSVTLPDGSAKLLDEVLGDDFTLLLATGASGPVSGLPLHPFWDRVRARRVQLLPPGPPLPRDTTVTTVVDHLGALAQYGSCVIVVRPDRYVAACMPMTQFAACTAAFARLVESCGRRERGGQTVALSVT